MVFLDADTQFQPDTLRLLVQPLAEPRVGAVSGHARVGNLQTWIARFQSLEYICGLQSSIAAPMIVSMPSPSSRGAISAFKKKAIQEASGHRLG